MKQNYPWIFQWYMNFSRRLFEPSYEKKTLRILHCNVVFSFTARILTKVLTVVIQNVSVVFRMKQTT